MHEFVASLVGHDDLVIHIAGWSITMFIAGGTILYKGIWKRINQIAASVDAVEREFNQLIGAHNAIQHLCGGTNFIERRATPRQEADNEQTD